jgi:acetyl esterase/lipase
MAAGHRLSYGSNSRQYVEIYPSENADKSRSCPLIIFIHGGGWYSGSTTDHEDLAKHISSESETAVALVTYRITNKDKPEENTVYHPDHINDVHAGLDLLFKSATSAEYRYDLKRVTLVGHSAGGWMVLSAALNSEANRNAGPVANMPPLKASIRKAIRSFVAVVSGNVEPVELLR